MLILYVKEVQSTLVLLICNLCVRMCVALRMRGRKYAHVIEILTALYLIKCPFVCINKRGRLLKSRAQL